MTAKDPVQEVLKAAVQVLDNVTYDGQKVPVTTTFNQASDRYIMLYVPSTDEDGTDDNYIFDVVLRVEVMTEFVTDYERETLSNLIMQQVTELLTDEKYFNAVLQDFNVVLVNPISGERDVQQENTSSVIIKRKDFNLKTVQL